MTWASSRTQGMCTGEQRERHGIQGLCTGPDRRGCTGDVSKNTGEDRGFSYGKEILEPEVMRFNWLHWREAERFEPGEQQGIGNAWLYRITVY